MIPTTWTGKTRNHKMIIIILIHDLAQTTWAEKEPSKLQLQDTELYYLPKSLLQKFIAESIYHGEGDPGRTMGECPAMQLESKSEQWWKSSSGWNHSRWLNFWRVINHSIVCSHWKLEITKCPSLEKQMNRMWNTNGTINNNILNI